MGEETIQFASRYSTAVGLLTDLVGDDTHLDLAKRHGPGLASAVRDALDAVEAVYGTGTEAVRDWPEQRRRVLAQLAATRAALDASGAGPDVRRMARTLVETIERFRRQ